MTFGYSASKALLMEDLNTFKLNWSCTLKFFVIKLDNTAVPEGGLIDL